MGILDKFIGKKGDDYLALIKEGEYDEAIELLKVLCEQDPKDTFIHLKLAECYEKLVKVDDAVDVLDQVVQIYTEDGYVAKAIAIQKKIARLKPERARPTSKMLAEEVETQKNSRDWEEVSLPPFFTLFEKDELTEILSEGVELREFQMDEIIIQEGDEGSTMYTIVEGRVKVFTQGPGGKEIVLAEMGPGDFFGEGSLLTAKPRTATIQAIEYSELLELSKAKMDEIIARYPRVEEVIRTFFEERAESTVEAMLDRLKED